MAAGLQPMVPASRVFIVFTAEIVPTTTEALLGQWQIKLAAAPRKFT